MGSFGAPGHRYHVLLVEDEPFSRRGFLCWLVGDTLAMKAKLGERVASPKTGLSVTCVETVEEALELLKKTNFAMVLLDGQLKNGGAGRTVADFVVAANAKRMPGMGPMLIDVSGNGIGGEGFVATPGKAGFAEWTADKTPCEMISALREQVLREAFEREQAARRAGKSPCSCFPRP